MKNFTKNKTIFLLSCIIFISLTKNVLADLLPPDGPWTVPVKPNPTPNSLPIPGQNSFWDLIQPQHIVIGGIVLAVIIISFAVLFKIRNKK